MTIEPNVLAGALVLVIGSLTVAITTILAAFGKMKVEILKELRAGSALLQAGQDSASVKAEEIHALVNGASVAAAAKLAALEAEVRKLHALVATVQEERIEDAKAAAAAARDTPLTKDAIDAHDRWERDEIAKAAVDLAENTRLTKAVHAVVVPTPPSEAE